MWIIKFLDHNGKDRQTQPFTSLLAAQLAQMFVLPIDPHCKIEEQGEAF